MCKKSNLNMSRHLSIIILAPIGTLEIKENEAEIVRLISDYYLAGASLGKVVDMLFNKHIPSPTGKARWTRAAVDHLLSNSKYIAVVGFEPFTSAFIKNLLSSRKQKTCSKKSKAC